MDAELKSKIAELIAMDLFYEEKLERFMELIQQEIAKARLDAQLVFAATLRAAGGEVTLSKKELMSPDDYRVTRYDNNLDGSVTFQVETLKELEAEL